MQWEEHKVIKVAERLWDKRPDGMMIDRGTRACSVVELKRRRDRQGDRQKQGD